jgi:single-stranded-DNA-specific exonuclease
VPDDTAVDALAASLNDLPSALARALVLREVDTYDDAHTFFRPSAKRLHDPFLMQDMEAAADRLCRAIRDRETVLVYGDYDVDGTTSTAMMLTFLREMGVEASFFIPNRFTHGYGLSEAGADVAAERGASLIVALDCGITAFEAARYIRGLGIDLVICDHHTATEEGIPDAVAVLDPKRPDCAYPFKGLSGCGVGFKLIQAVLLRLGLPAEDAEPYLDLVAISTASDIVPMVGENRILMRAGLKRLSEAPRLGLQLLAERAGVDLGCCTSSRIVFQIGPRINAAGRIEDAGLAADLMSTTDPIHAQSLVDAIEALNERRRELDRETCQQALVIAEELMKADPVALVVHHEGWHPGVIGITASRVAERFHRPTVLLTSSGDGVAKGSARSVKGISIYAALAQCEDLFHRFGGHDFAAGLALPVERVEELRERLQPAVQNALIGEDALTPEIELDARLDLHEVSPRFWSVLQQFGPHGPDNLRPLFWGTDLRVVGQPTRVGAQKQHLRMRVAQRAGGPTFSTIGFGLADRYETALASVRRSHPLELAFHVEENQWNGQTELQLRLVDLRLTED